MIVVSCTNFSTLRRRACLTLTSACGRTPRRPQVYKGSDRALESSGLQLDSSTARRCTSSTTRVNTAAAGSTRGEKGAEKQGAHKIFVRSSISSIIGLVRTSGTPYTALRLLGQGSMRDLDERRTFTTTVRARLGNGDLVPRRHDALLIDA